MRVGGQLQSPAALPPGKRHGTHCIGGWVGPRAGLDGFDKSRSHRDSIPGPSSPQRVTIPTTLSRPILIIIYDGYFTLFVQAGKETEARIQHINSLSQARSAFYVAQATSAKFNLDAGNAKYYVQ
jgi:hypothetical protein